MPPTICHRVELVAEPSDDPEVATATSDRPEQVGIRRGVDVKDVAVSSHELGGEHAVDREAMLSREVPDSTFQRDAPDPIR
jgi:hypothetical protein